MKEQSKKKKKKKKEEKRKSKPSRKEGYKDPELLKLIFSKNPLFIYIFIILLIFFFLEKNFINIMSLA